MIVRLLLPGPEDTQRLGERLAATLPGPAVVYLRGDLGAGKSALARAMLQALGAAGTIRSPTYTLVERHGIRGGDAAHLDLYRIAAAGELEFLGLQDLLPGLALVLVEWPERGEGALPTADLRVGLEVAAGGRIATLEGGTALGRRWLEQLGPSPQPAA